MRKGEAEEIAVIGGGMAGICSAILLAEAGRRVMLFERQDRIGKKLLLTGNGRCNLSNLTPEAEHYLTDDREKLVRILNTLTPKRRERFFDGLGLKLCEIRGGLYPVTRQASSVLDAFRFRLRELAVDIRTESFVRAIDGDRNITLSDGRRFGPFQRILLAAGGRAGVYAEEKDNALTLAKELTGSLVKTYPALCAIRVKEELKAAAGVRCDAGITLHTPRGSFTERGELQITKGALSGIPVFQLSRYLEDTMNSQISVDFLPFLEGGEACLSARAEHFSQRSLEEFFAGILNKKLAVELLHRADLAPSRSVSAVPKEALLKLFRLCRSAGFTPAGYGSYKDAQLMCGGVPLSALSDELECRQHPGVHILGELLNVNGECGGYNLHFALACAMHVCDRLLSTEK
ncbi:MAG: aminoacetone oxidase family FAD-binding enzyme [Lachnospiraceae bacterium]|nr:aminoacetone oxidase family FAD-binding enzyme [Lachnospiraceae bacterium]